MSRQRRETPVKRKNPSGKVRWVARYTNAQGMRVSAGTFKLKGEAQDAIDAAHDRPANAGTLGAYAATWTSEHPRAQRTNDTNDHRISRVLDVEIGGRLLRDWPYRELKRKQAHELVRHMLVEQGRSASGAVNILRALSAMSEDAITDEVADVNAFKGVRVRANDPRVTKQPKAHVVYSFDEMHALAAVAGAHEPALRVLSDCGLRIGELLGLERRDYRDGMLHLRGSAHEGVFTEGNQPTKIHVRSVPIPPAWTPASCSRRRRAACGASPTGGAPSGIPPATLQAWPARHRTVCGTRGSRTCARPASTPRTSRRWPGTPSRRPRRSTRTP